MKTSDWPLVRLYDPGLTENSPVMTQTLPDDDVRRRSETVGKAMPGVEVNIFDEEGREDLSF